MQTIEDQIKRVGRAMLTMQRYCWEQGMAMQAFYELKDWDTVELLAYEAAYRGIPDGRVAVIGEPATVTDPCGCGEALLAVAQRTDSPFLRSAASGLLKWALVDAPRNKDGLLYHLMDSRQFWADSIYMLPPWLAAAGKYDEAVQTMCGYWEILYDKQASLMHHMWDDEHQRFVRAAHWGTGSGWTLAGLARLVALLPQSYSTQAKRLAEMARSLLDGVLRHLRTDGMFYDIVDDPNSFPELNLSQMTTYTIFRGVADGWLNKSYLEPAERLRSAAWRGVDAMGFIRPVCGAPDFNKPGVSVEAQAFFLLMESAAAHCDAAQPTLIL